MGKTVNKVFLLGSLGRDPETSFSQGGMSITKLNMATNHRIKVGEDEWEEKTDWHRVTAFNKLSELCQEYLTKGSQLMVQGEIRYGSYEKDGVTRYTTEIIANEISFCGQGGSGRSDGRQQQDAAPSSAPAVSDDDIPF